MSLDIDLWLHQTPDRHKRIDCVYSSNISHNLGPMARQVGIYMAMWRPEEIGCVRGGHLINRLMVGLELLKDDPDRYMPLSPTDGWGSYDGLVEEVDQYLRACIEHPHAVIHISR